MVQGALKQATALLGKYKGDQLARLLKAWALKGSGKQAAALEVLLSWILHKLTGSARLERLF